MESVFGQSWIENGVTQAVRLDSWRQIDRKGYTWNDLVNLLRHSVRIAWLSRHYYVYWGNQGGDDAYAGPSPLITAGDNDDEGNHHTHHLQLAIHGNEGWVCLCSVMTEQNETEPPDSYIQQLFQLLRKSSPGTICVLPRDDMMEDSSARADRDPTNFPASAETLANILVSPNTSLAFEGFDFTQDHCRRLSSFRGSIEVEYCSLADNGRGMLEAIGSNRGLTGLSLCNMLDYGRCKFDLERLCEALGTTTSLRELTLFNSDSPPCPLLCSALEQNESLESLGVECLWFPDQDDDEPSEQECVVNIARSVRSHPTLQTLTFQGWRSEHEEDLNLLDRVTATNDIFESLQENTVLREVELASVFVDEERLEEMMQPYLQANLYRPRVAQLLEEADKRVQLHLLTRALTTKEVHDSPALTFQLLSGCLHLVVSESYEARMRRTIEAADETGGASRRGRKRPRSFA